MSTVQEIEAALARLSRQELESVEKSIAEVKRQRDKSDPHAYAKAEYGVSDEDLERFDQRMKTHNAEAIRKGETTVFPGPFDPSSLD
jgi:hypothetical protein